MRFDRADGFAVSLGGRQDIGGDAGYRTFNLAGGGDWLAIGAEQDGEEVVRFAGVNRRRHRAGAELILSRGFEGDQGLAGAFRQLVILAALAGGVEQSVEGRAEQDQG